MTGTKFLFLFLLFISLFAFSVKAFDFDMAFTVFGTTFNHPNENYTHNFEEPWNICDYTGIAGEDCYPTKNSYSNDWAFSVTSPGIGTKIIRSNYRGNISICEPNDYLAIFDVNLENKSSDTSNPRIVLNEKHFSINAMHIYIDREEGNITTSFGGTWANSEKCSFKVIENPPEANMTGRMGVSMDLDNLKYSVFWDSLKDDTENSCEGKNLVKTGSMPFCVGGIDIYGTSALVPTLFYVDNIHIGWGNAIGSCTAPSLFCDDFSDPDPLCEDWYVYDEDWDIDCNLTAVNGTLCLLGDEVKRISHQIEPFPVEYRISENEIITESIYAPVFSSEFKINVLGGNSTDAIIYEAQDSGGRLVTRIKSGLESEGNLSWYYYNFTVGGYGEYKVICRNCTINGTPSFIDTKIIFYFANSPFYPFNSTISHNYIELYVNGRRKGGEIPFFDNTSQNIGKIEIYKPDVGSFCIDNYITMIGTDPYVDTTSNYYDDFYDDEEVISTTDGDLASNIESLWWQFGVRSTASRIIVALILMLTCSLGIVGIMLSKGAQPSIPILLFINFILMIFFTYIRLLPVWLTLMVGILGAGIGALSFARSFSSGG